MLLTGGLQAVAQHIALQFAVLNESPSVAELTKHNHLAVVGYKGEELTAGGRRAAKVEAVGPFIANNAIFTELGGLRRCEMVYSGSALGIMDFMGISPLSFVGNAARKRSRAWCSRLLTVPRGRTSRRAFSCWGSCRK